MEFLKGFVASFWPQGRRRWWYPESTAVFLRAALVSGVMEFCLFGYLEFVQFRGHFLGVAEHFSKGNIGTQLVAVLLMVVSEVFYPLSLLLIFLTAEGFVRAVAAAFFDEGVPSLPVVLGVKIWDRLARRPKPLTGNGIH